MVKSNALQKAKSVAQERGTTVVEILNKQANLRNQLMGDILINDFMPEVIQKMQQDFEATPNLPNFEVTDIRLSEDGAEIGEADIIETTKNGIFMDSNCAIHFTLSFTVKWDEVYAGDSPAPQFKVKLSGNRGSETFQDRLSVQITQNNDDIRVNTHFASDQNISNQQFLNAMDSFGIVDLVEPDDQENEDIFNHLVDNDQLLFPVKPIEITKK